MRPSLRTFAAVLFAFAAACSGGSAPSGSKRAAVEVGASPQLGPADAWVTLVEFSDFECPYCAAEEPVLRQLLQAHPQDLRLVYKHFTLPQHANARGAAIAAECAGDQNRFWEMHDQLFANQDALDAAHLPAYALAAGVPEMSVWQTCLGLPEPAARVDADLAVASALGLAGTPTLIVNGQVYAGEYPYDALEQIIAGALERAQQSGIPRASYYDQVVLGK